MAQIPVAESAERTSISSENRWWSTVAPGPTLRDTESAIAVTDPVTHQLVHSEGLLQLTYQDQQRYGCNFNWEADRHLPPHDPQRTILNPENNLSCGIRILSNQVIDQHKPIFAHTSYWSTLQPGTAGYRVRIY